MRALRLSGALHVALGLGFGLGSVMTLRHLAMHGELPMTPWGFRSMSGPAEALGRPGFMALGWALAAVCALDVVAGWMLWNGRRAGARLAAVNSPIAFGLAVAFALPVLLIGVPARAALIVIGRRALR